MAKIFVTRQIPEAGIKLFQEKGYEVEVFSRDEVISREELLANVKGRDAVLCLLTDKMNAEVFEAAAGVPGRNDGGNQPRIQSRCRPDLRRLLPLLGAEGIDSVLIEAGAELAWSALSAGVVDSVRCYYAPLIIGGQRSTGAVGGAGYLELGKALRLQDMRVERIGEDIVMEGTACLPD